MVDDTLEDAGSGRVKRAPPTIELKASEVSSETRPAPSDIKPAPSEAEPAAEMRPEPKEAPASESKVEPEARSEPAGEPKGEPADPEPPRAAAAPSISPSISPWVIAPFSGAVAAALVILVGWMLGWPPVQPAGPSPSAAAIDNLTARMAGLESKSGKFDSAAAVRLDALEKSQGASRSDLANLRAQTDKLASAVNEARSAPGGAAGGAIDIAALNERIDQLERNRSAQGAEAAQQKPVDDVPLRRVVAAALLDVAVRHGDPYPAALAAAKSLAPNPDALKPLDEFAATGVPNPPALSRELLTLVPKLSPTPPPDNATTGSGVVDRLQAGAAKLVRIERTDASGNDRGAVVARVTAAALRNDLAEARRELLTLAPADRAPAQGWLDKAASRDAAFAASRQFAGDAMAALAKPGQ